MSLSGELDPDSPGTRDFSAGRVLRDTPPTGALLPVQLPTEDEMRLAAVPEQAPSPRPLSDECLPTVILAKARYTDQRRSRRGMPDAIRRIQ
jgi:hypothetical protein